MGERIVPPSMRWKAMSLQEYQRIYSESVRNLEGFWAREAGKLKWREPWRSVREGAGPASSWFVGASLSPYENVVSKHEGTWVWHKPALIWENEAGDSRIVTYAELDSLASRLAAGLASLGVGRGDWVVVYSQPSIESVAAMLAAVKLGAPFEPVFTGFSAEELARRLARRKAKALVTSSGFLRRGRAVPLAGAAREALSRSGVQAHLVVAGEGAAEGGIALDDLLQWGSLKESAVVSSNHPLFGLHSGYEDGFHPIAHPAGGFLVQVYSTSQWIGLRPRDTYFCTVWPGWITGVSYVVFGPLMVGSTVLLYEGGPDWPSWNRWLELIDSYAVTLFLTTSSALRMMSRQEPSALTSNNDTLKAVLVTAEPLEAEVWRWSYERLASLTVPVVDSDGRRAVPVVNLYIQSEVGTFLTGNLVNYTFPPVAPGSAGPPIPGFHLDVVDERGASVRGAPGRLVVKGSWPSMPVEAPSVFRERWAGEVYDTGDEAVMLDSYIHPLGRRDPVLKVSGYRLSPGAIERAAESLPGVRAAVAAGLRDELRFEVPVLVYEGEAEPGEVRRRVREAVGPIAEPQHVFRVSSLRGARAELRAKLKRLLREKTLEEAVRELAAGQP
ncbi:MAG: AMP-binding protein [Thermofilum sp.]